MSHPASAALFDATIYPENVLFLGARNLAEGTRFVTRPETERVLGWLRKAEAHRERCLSHYDLALAVGDEPTAVALVVVWDYLEWTRASMREFSGGAVEDTLTTSLRSQEHSLWNLLADTAAAGAARDAGTVDRFLRVWLTVVYEAIRTGNAPLYAAAAVTP